MRLKTSALTIVGLLSLTHGAAAQITVRPTLIDFATGPNADSRAIFIKNTGTKDQSYRIYFADYNQITSGDHQFLDFGAHEKSCKDRVNINQPSIRVAPQEEGQLVVTMQPGSETCWSLVFIEQTAPPSPNGRSVVTQRVGVKLYGSNPSLRTPVPVLEGLAFDHSSDGPALRLMTANTGNHILQLSGRIEVYKTNGEPVGAITVRPFTILENHQRSSLHPLPKELEAGDYVAIAILQDKDGKRIGKRVSFKATLATN